MSITENSPITVPHSFLFVCLGNICRSPMAMMMALHRDIAGATFDSAGTHAADRREPIDPRAAAELERRGVALRPKARSRRIQPADFERFEHVLAMDRSNLAHLHEICPTEYRGKLHLFLDWSAVSTGLEVPDPYYGGPEGFSRVYDLCLQGVEGIAQRLQEGLTPLGQDRN